LCASCLPCISIYSLRDIPPCVLHAQGRTSCFDMTLCHSRTIVWWGLSVWFPTALRGNLTRWRVVLSPRTVEISYVDHNENRGPLCASESLRLARKEIHPDDIKALHVPPSVQLGWGVFFALGRGTVSFPAAWSLRLAPEWHVKNGIRRSILGRHHGNKSPFRHGRLVSVVFALGIARSKLPGNEIEFVPR
jgi:hypothetical protein